jgi:hypothetical protein
VPGQRRTLFSIQFKSALTDADLARLRTALDLVTYIQPKPGVSAASPGVVPLDLWSGLFLVRGDGEDEWALEARTWGDPPAAVVHEWQVTAAIAARQLDPSVEVPSPEEPTDPDTPLIEVGRAASSRRGRLGRRLLRLD